MIVKSDIWEVKHSVSINPVYEKMENIFHQVLSVDMQPLEVTEFNDIYNYDEERNSYFNSFDKRNFIGGILLKPAEDIGKSYQIIENSVGMAFFIR